MIDETQAQMLYQSALNGHLGDVVHYSLGTAGDEGFFTINAYTGELSLNTALTYEHPMDANGDGIYEVEVIATDAEGLNASQIVSVTLNNINVAPVISGTLLDPIEEEIGRYVYDFTVADADTAPGNLIIQVTDNRFTIDDGGGFYRVRRLNSHRFDYETNPDYSFDLIVSDGVEQDTVNIAFTLTNINDNTPVVIFTSAGPVTENDPGAVLGTIAVTDADGPTTFYYDIFPTSVEVAADGVTVKLKDGVALDYEQASSFVLNVAVSDEPLEAGTGNLGVAFPTITVLNVNDVAPSNIQLSANQVSENNAGAVVGTLSAVDQDGPSLGFSVSDPRFEVDGTSLKLVDGLALDREATPSVTLTVTASDGTFEGAEDFTITVLNVDEGPPANLALSNASIPENSTGAIGQLSASDVDGDTITFTENDSRFAISGTTLSLTSAINHESLAEGTVSLDITATGGGASTTVTFVITIEDVNEAPTLKMTVGPATNLTGSLSLTVLENVRQATFAASADPGAEPWPISFVASDVDDDALSYVLGGTDASSFTVDPATGALNFVTPADFESPADANGDGTYNVTVSVTDGELGSNTITLGLQVLDTADEPYDLWIAGFFPGETDPAIIGPEAIAAGGLSNALCFAFNLSPLDPSPSALQQVEMDPDTRAFEFACRRDAAYFLPTIGFSTTLSGFSTIVIPATTTTVAPGIEIVVTRDGIAPGIDQVTLRVDRTRFPHFFARLGVEIP